jgi:uncharacterized membrane protein YedE/YeeE
MKDLLNPLESKQKWVALLSGLLIGMGVCLSGLAKIDQQTEMLSLSQISLNYWVSMLVAFLMMAAAFKWTKKRTHPLLDNKMHIPLGKDIDAKLLIGSALVGAGFALTGMTPAIAIASAGAGVKEGIVFFIAMSVGMAAYFFYKESIEELDRN